MQVCVPAQARRRALGNIQFIGVLFKQKMLTEKIMHQCIMEPAGRGVRPRELFWPQRTACAAREAMLRVVSPYFCLRVECKVGCRCGFRDHAPPC